jgi:hypothetical protein
MNRLPYRLMTPSGEEISFDFPLHPETGSAMRVHQLLECVLHALSHEIALLGETRNGDLLQALAMAMAVRTEMIPAEPAMTHQLAREVLEKALGALSLAQHRHAMVGHA